MANGPLLQRILVPYGSGLRVPFTTFLSGAISKSITWAKHTVQISKDFGSFTSTSNSPSELGSTGFHTIQLSGSESTCAYGCIRFVDNVGGEFDEFQIIFETIECDTSGYRFGDLTSDLRRTAGIALATSASGYVPVDARRVDGVALATHTSGYFPGDVRRIDGSVTSTYRGLVADSVWDEARSGHTTGGTFGGDLSVFDAAIDPVSIQGSDVASIVDAVWEESLADHFAVSGSTAEALRDFPGAVWDELLSAHTSAGTAGKSLADTETDVTAILVDTGTTLPAQITSEINDVQSDIAALNNISVAEVNAEVDTALSDIGLDHLLSASVTGTDITDDSIVAQLVSKSGTADWDSFDNTTDSLEALSDATPTIDTAAIADAVWDEALAGHATAGSAGATLSDVLTDTGTTLPATLSTLSADLATVDGIVDAILVDTGTTLPAQITALNDIDATGVADAVWDAVTGSHADVNSFGLAVASILQDTSVTLESRLITIDGIVDAILVDTGTTIPAQISGLSIPTAAAISDAVWDEATAGHTTAGTFGLALGTTIQGTLTTIDGVVDAILVDTGDILTNLATVDSNVDAILVDTDTTIPALIAALNDLDATAVADAVWDATTGSYMDVNSFGLAVGEILTDTGVTIPSTISSTAAATQADIAALNDLSAAEVNAEVDTALADIGLDHLLSASVTGTDVADDSVIAQLVSSSATADWDDFDNTTDSLEAISAGAGGGGGPSAADIADAVWEEALADHSGTAGSVAEALDTAATASGLTVADIADGVWDELYGGHAISGSFGELAAAVLTDTGTTIPAQISGLAIPTAAQNADAVWDEATADHTTAGTYGLAAGTTTPAALVTIDGIVDAILVDTGTTLDGKLDTIDGIVDAILVDTGTTIPATLSSLSSDVTTIDGIVDDILTDTGTSLPATLATLATASALATVDSNVDAILVDTGTTIPAAIAALNDFDPSSDGVFLSTAGVNAVADQVWDEVLSGHTTAGTTGAALDAVAAPASAADIADAVWDEAFSGHVTAGTFGLLVQDINTDVEAILVDTGTTLPATLAGLATQSSVDTIDGIVDDILTDTGTTLPATLATLATSAALATVDGIVDAILVDTDTTIPGLIAALNDPSAADVADAVWDEAKAGHVTAGSFGEEVQAHALSSEVSGLATASALATVDSNVDAILVDTGTTLPATLATLATAADLATIDGIVDAILVDTGTTLPANMATIEGKIDTIDGIVDSILVDTGTTLPAAIAALNDPSAAAIADAVWDELLAGHVISGSSGEALGAVAAPPSAASIADAVWDEALSGHTTAGTAGKALQDVETDVSAILVDTGTTLPSTLSGLATAASIAALNDLSSADVQLAMTAQGYTAARAANLDNLDAAISSVATAVAALNDLSSSDVQSAMTAQGYTTVRAALLDNLDAAISTVVSSLGGLNDLSSADVTAALTAQGLTTTRAGYLDNLPTILTGTELVRKIEGNKVVIAPDDETVTVYEDDGTTVAVSFTISTDGRTRTPD